MAVTFTGAGTAQNATSQTSVAVTTATAFAVGDYLVALMAYDNSGGGGADPMSGTIALSGGFTGASVSAQTGLNDPGTASSGLAVRCVAFPVTSTIATSTSITVSWSGSAVAKAVVFMKVSSAAVTGYRTNSGATGVTTGNVAVTNAAALVTPSVNNGEGVLCWAAEENGIALGGDSDTTNGSWGTIYGTFNATTAGVGGMAAYFQAKVVTATATQSFSATGNATASDWITGCLIFTETPVPAITQAAYRIYDDGTETGAVALGAQDTAVNGDITAGDGIGQLRVRLQSTNAGILNATDDYQLQWEKNASGSWTNVGSGDVLGYASPNITEGQATTNRLGAGTGSFVAGKAAEDGLVDNHSWSSNNYTELLYTVAIVKANVAAGDVIRFRVLRNGVTTGMTYSATPTVNVVAQTVTQAAYRFYEDGTETGSTALAAQDTAAPGSITSGDLNVQLRVRLQSTSVATIPATDDWQLQWEKNASGTWTNIAYIGYADSNSDNVTSIGSSPTGRGQSFLGNGKDLTRVGFYCTKVGTVTAGTLTAKLYAHTGTFGASGTPTGSALATCTSTIDVSAVASGSYNWYFWDFSAYTLVDTQPYFVTIDITGYAGTGNISLGADTSSPSHPGNAATFTASWASLASADIIFEVQTTGAVVAAYASANITDAGATTNRLGAGSGSFVAGEISETGLVTDAGWSGNNFTEMLYSITLKAADLANGDTLRFRVLKNGSTANLTYTATPTINVITTPAIVATPGVVSGSGQTYAPTILTSSTATPSAVAGTSTTPAPTVARVSVINIGHKVLLDENGDRIFFGGAPVTYEDIVTEADTAFPIGVLVVSNIVATPPVVSGTGTTLAPTIATSPTITTPAVARTGTTLAPTFSIGTTATPAALAQTATTLAPTIQTSPKATPAVVTAAGATYMPTIALTSNAVALPAVVVGTSATYLPTMLVSGSATALPATVAGTGTTLAPVTQVSATHVAAVVTATGSTLASSVTVSATATHTPVSRTGATAAPTSAITSIVAPSTVARTGQTNAPGLTQGSTASLAAVSGTGTAFAVTIATTGNAVAVPAVLVGTGTPLAPTVIATASATATPAGVARTGQTNAPTLAANALAVSDLLVGVGEALTAAGVTTGNAEVAADVVTGSGTTWVPTPLAETSEVIFDFEPGIINITFAGVGDGEIDVSFGAIYCPTYDAFSATYPPSFLVTGTAIPAAPVARTGTTHLPVISISESVVPLVVQGTGTAYGATATVSPTATPIAVAGTGQTYLPAFARTAMAITSPLVGIGTVQSPGVSESVTALVTTGTGTTYVPSIARSSTATPPVIARTGTTNPPTFLTGVVATATVVAGTSQVLDPVVKHSAALTPATATATGTGYDAITTQEAVTAATDGIGTGTAYNASIVVAAQAEVCNSTAVVYDGTVRVDTAITPASGTGAGFNASLLIELSTSTADAIGSAFTPSQNVSITATSGAAEGVAYDIDKWRFSDDRHWFFDGEKQVNGNPHVWNGHKWVRGTLKVWDGHEWN